MNTHSDIIIIIIIILVVVVAIVVVIIILFEYTYLNVYMENCLAQKAFGRNSSAVHFKCSLACSEATRT